MKILVAGGTGLNGRAIVSAMIAAGHSTSVMSRRRPNEDPFAGQAAWVEGDVTRPETLTGALAGMDVVVDAVQFPNSPIENPRKGHTFERVDLGGTKNLVDAAKAAGTAHFIDISGAGAAEDAPYHWQRYKWAEEQHLLASGLPHTVFRPSWVYGPRDVALNRFLGFARWLPFVPVVGNGKARINPLFIEDLGAHVAAAVTTPGAKGQIFEIGGPQVLTMDEIVATALKVAGKRRLLLHQPKALMKAIASVLQFVPGRPLTPDAIDFITMDGIADNEQLITTFGLPLTALDEGLAQYLRR